MRKLFIGAGLLVLASLFVACGDAGPGSNPASEESIPKNVARRFAFPVGDGRRLTEARDAIDDWYNAQDFGENRHLGEDWNGNAGGNSDCGSQVISAADGTIVYAGDAGPGWGNVVIVNHILPEGTLVQTLYGHLREITKASGEVRIREKVGTVGDANGQYPCHLHFELRERGSRAWARPGPGYSENPDGWLDPSEFIEGRIKNRGG